MATWFITGASSGIGSAIADAALAKGDKVIAASRDAQKLVLVEEKGAISVSFNINGNGEAIISSVQEIIKTHGPIDIVVNNAAYGQFGSLEETGIDLLEKQFTTNVFGPVKVINAFLPHFRTKKAGLFINIGSRVGYEYVPYYSLYDSSKAALQIISATLDKEVQEFGIRSVLVEPGAFKTAFLDDAINSLRSDEDSEQFPAKISDYDKTRNTLKGWYASYYDKQPGDPRALAEHVVNLAHKEGAFADEVPEIISFGKDSVDAISKAANYHLERLEKWKDVSYSTDKFA